MKLNFTRKTWYFFLLASAAVSMLNGFFVLAGQTFGLLEQIAFCLAAIAAGLSLLGAGLARPAAGGIPARQAHPAAASAGGHLGSAPPAVSAPDGLRRRVCHEFLDQHPLGAAGLRPGLGCSGSV